MIGMERRNEKKCVTWILYHDNAMWTFLYSPKMADSLKSQLGHFLSLSFCLWYKPIEEDTLSIIES